MNLRSRIVVMLAALCVSAPTVVAQDGGPTGALHYSADVRVAGLQRSVRAVVERYQVGLNGSDFAAIRQEFAPNAVAEWNGKTTVVGVASMAAPYAALFRTTKFATDFQFDAVDVYGDVAIVRTHHPVGQTERDLATGATRLDFNREIFVLRRIAGAWKIILYTFNAQPRQGEP